MVRFLGYRGIGMQVVSAVGERRALPHCRRWICFAYPSLLQRQLDSFLQPGGELISHDDTGTSVPVQ